MSGEKKIKIGVYGAGRGAYLAQTAINAGFELVAICDFLEEKAKEAKRCLENLCPNLTIYTDYDKFLEHDLDAVILANYATQHAPAAIKALRAGKHVLSECMAMFTMGEAVELAEAVEESGLVYSFGENYPYSLQNMEMTRLYQSGEMGKFIYGEAEYVHPCNQRERVGLTPSLDHWRAWIPVTYYSTHSMGPIMKITGTRPVRVNGFVVPHDYDDHLMHGGAIKYDDTMSILMCQMDNGALAKIMPCAKLRDHGNRVRICANKGTMEYNQGHDGILRVRRMRYDWPAEQPEQVYYHPKFPAEYKDAAGFGHGGGDFFTTYFFAEAIRGHRPPEIDVYQAIDMTAIGILGWKSALNNGAPIDIIDFRDKKAREIYRGDNWNPDPSIPCENKPPCSVLGKVNFTDEEIAQYHKLVEEIHGKKA